MKNIILSLLLVFGFATLAKADVFGPHPASQYQTTNPATGEQITIEPQTIFDDVINIIKYLGQREGSVYDFKRKEFVTYTGATLYTYKSVALDIGMLNLDGVGVSIDYNLGALLPTKGIPILQYTQYLYVGGGWGYRFDSSASKWKSAPFIGGQFKLTF